MRVRTQDGLTVIPCEAISGQHNDQYKAWDILCISPATGKPIKLLGTFFREDQFRNVFSELQSWLEDRNRRHQTYYMPPDVQAIKETSISFTDLNMGIK